MTNKVAIDRQIYRSCKSCIRKNRNILQIKGSIKNFFKEFRSNHSNLKSLLNFFFCNLNIF